MKQKKSNRKTISKIGKSTLVTILAGALSILSSAPFTSKLADPRPTLQLSSYQQLLSEKSSFKPDVYLVLLNHPHELTGSWTYASDNCMDEVVKITHLLSEKYASNTLLPEGLEPGTDEVFEKRGYITLRESNKDTPSGRFFNKLETLINSKKWNLLVAESGNERERYESLRVRLNFAYSQIISEARRETESSDFSKSLKSENEINEKLKRAWASFFTPQRTAELYELGVTNRDRNYVLKCKEAKESGKTPVTFIYGSAHILTITRELENNGLSYRVIKPSNISKINPVTPEGLKERHLIKINLDKKR